MNLNEARYFHPRCPGTGPVRCSVCNGYFGQQTDMAVWTQTVQNSLEIIAMFAHEGISSQLVYRDIEPQNVMVKFGACKAHHYFLNMLFKHTEDNRIITMEIIARAKREQWLYSVEMEKVHNLPAFPALFGYSDFYIEAPDN